VKQRKKANRPSISERSENIAARSEKANRSEGENETAESERVDADLRSVHGARDDALS
jgi:hypothetical protein